MWVQSAVELGEKEKSEVQISKGNKDAGSAVTAACSVREGRGWNTGSRNHLPLVMEKLASWAIEPCSLCAVGGTWPEHPARTSVSA